MLLTGMQYCYCGSEHKIVEDDGLFPKDPNNYFRIPMRTVETLNFILQCNPATHTTPEMAVTGWTVYREAKQWIITPTVCLAHLQDAINLSLEAIKWIFGDDYVDSQDLAVTLVVVTAAESMARRMMGLKAVVTDELENIIWTIVGILPKWNPKFLKDVHLSPRLKYWTTCMLNNVTMCPNVYLRLEMFRFIQMWPQAAMADRNCGVWVANGLVSLSSYLRLDNLMEVTGSSLAHPLTSVLRKLCFHGYMAAYTNEALCQLRHLSLNTIVRGLAHLVTLASEKAQNTRHLYTVGSLSLPLALEAFNSVLNMLDVLLTSSPIAHVFETPGMTQTGAAAFVSTTSSMLAIGHKLQAETAQIFYAGLHLLDSLCWSLIQRKCVRSVAALLRRNHRHEIINLNQNVEDIMGFNPLRSLQSLAKEDEEYSYLEKYCPEEYLDSLTQDVMESPVLLKSSNMMVDESTLVNLLLVSPKDPFTRAPLDQDSFSRQPSVQQDITAWRNAMKLDYDTSKEKQLQPQEPEECTVTAPPDEASGSD